MQGNESEGSPRGQGSVLLKVLRVSAPAKFGPTCAIIIIIIICSYHYIIIITWFATRSLGP